MPFASQPPVPRIPKQTRRPAAAVKSPKRSAWPVRTPINPLRLAPARPSIAGTSKVAERADQANRADQARADQARADQANRAARARLLRAIEGIGAGATIAALLVIAMFG